MPSNYVKITEIKKIAKGLNMRISQQAIIDSNDFVADLLKKAAYRAKMNGRVTIMPQDL